jgi:hypothetical protein
MCSSSNVVCKGNAVIADSIAQREGGWWNSVSVQLVI